VRPLGVVALADPDSRHSDPPVLGQNQPDATSQQRRLSQATCQTLPLHHVEMIRGYFGAMSNLLAVLTGALVGVGGVIAGTWLQSRKEHQRWLRDQKLRAAIDFIGATRDLHDRRRRPAANPDPSAERDAWARIQDGRSALYLLCATSTVEVAEALITGVRHTPADSGPRDDETIALLRDLVRRLRLELGAGTG
jgi:hypothetical protein